MHASATSARSSPNLQSALADLHAVLTDADMAYAIPLSEASVRAAIPQVLAEHRTRTSQAKNYVYKLKFQG